MDMSRLEGQLVNITNALRDIQDEMNRLNETLEKEGERRHKKE